MTTDIFIRTYDKDLPWLKYCLMSIHKFATGFRNIIVCIPVKEKHMLDHLTQEKIVTCPVYEDDYIGQQLTKMMAIEFTDAAHILFMDSDCIFTEPVSPTDFMIMRKPVIIKEKFERFLMKDQVNNDAYARKEKLEKYFGMRMDYEYMRRHPFIYTRKSMELFNILGHILNNGVPDGMSEFNMMGFLCDKLFHDDYAFLEVGVDKIPLPKVKQFWSYSGLTEKEEKELMNYLK